ncbi:ABC transporter ATP-binding protein [Paenibacillus mesotrionivorans]|jgi:ABC-2 type transport system ATP-binding protein|uniref:ABC transporter ATP-binding protein n=1 Tax=Paenibacillus mesotrionivorans TaxID=3160968 RepID=A0ACC7P5C4_9BACL
MEQIRTERLTKRYGTVSVVQDVSLSVQQGEVYGFLGLNGAGKTTTIRTLLGMIKPTSGDVFLFGNRVSESGSRLWNQVGYMVEMPAAYPGFTVRENLLLMAKLRGLKPSDSVDRVMKELNLDAYADRKAKFLSLGNMQKLGLAKALLHNPDILILDEPTNALDPAGIVEIRELLIRLAKQEGKTVFISSHILEEVAKMATRIGIIHKGVMLQEITAEEFETIRQKRLYIGVGGQREAARVVLADKGYQAREVKEGLLELADERAVRHPECVAKLLADAGLPLSLLKVEEEELESYFLKTIGAKEVRA